MDHKWIKLLAAVLAVGLVLSLAGCSQAVDGDEDGLKADRLGDGDVPSPEKDPWGYIGAMTANTMEELSARYQGSPLAAIADALEDRGSLTVSADIPQEGITLEGTLSYDATAPSARLEGSARAQGVELALGAYMDGEFWGVSVPMLFGDDGFYGFRPSGLYDQVSESVLGQVMDRESLESFRQLDELLEVLKDAPALDLEAVQAEWQELYDEMAGSMELEAVRASGQDREGWVISGEMDSQALADAMEKLYDKILSAGLWDTLERLAQATGGEFQMDTSREDLRAQLEELRSSGASCRYQWYTLDDRLVKVVVTPVDASGAEAEMTVNFFDGNAVTVTIGDGEDETVLRSAVSNGDGYTHTVTLVQPGIAQEDLTVTWSGDGALSLTASQYGDTVTLSARLEVKDGGFTLSDVAADGQEMPVTVSYTPGGAVTAPERAVNIFELSEDELVELVERVQSALG